MKSGEWDQIVAVMAANWPHDVPSDAVLAKWFADLADLPAEQVLTAVETFNRDGERYMPNGGRLRARIAELGEDEMDFGEAWELVRKAGLKFGWHHEHEPGRALAFVAERSAAAAEAVRQFQPACLVYSLRDEPTVRAQFRDVYNAVRNRLGRERRYEGLPSAGLRFLERGRGLRRIEAGHILAGQKQLTEGEANGRPAE